LIAKLAMNVTLTPESEAILERMMAFGTYHDASEAVNAALHQINASYQRQLEQLQTEIQRGLDSGPATPLDMEDAICRGQERLAAKQRTSR